MTRTRRVSITEIAVLSLVLLSIVLSATFGFAPPPSSNATGVEKVCMGEEGADTVPIMVCVIAPHDAGARHSEYD